MRNRKKGNICLLTAALVWGCGLVAQKAGMDFLGPFGFTAIRCTLGGVVMLPLIYFLGRRKPATEQTIQTELPEAESRCSKKYELKGSIICGVILASLIIAQQLGLPYTTVGKAGFITALYILITPIMGIFLGKKVRRILWLAVVIALGGMYLLCMKEGISGINYGDVMMFVAAVLCSAHMHFIDHFVERIDPVKLSSYQFIVAGVLCVIPTIMFEEVTMEAVKAGIIPILYAGIGSCAVGYTFQIIGQKYTEPNLASLILSLETVFTLLAGFVFFREILSIREYAGCVVMFAAIVIAQIPEKDYKISPS